eukprot:5103030-Prymnesium_polylepis.1
MCAVCVSHPPTRGNVPAYPDEAPCLPACPVVSIHFRQKIRASYQVSRGMVAAAVARQAAAV